MAKDYDWHGGVVNEGMTLGEALEIARSNGGAVMVGRIGKVAGILTVADARTILANLIDENGGQERIDELARGVEDGSVPTFSPGEVFDRSGDLLKG